MEFYDGNRMEVVDGRHNGQVIRLEHDNILKLAGACFGDIDYLKAFGREFSHFYDLLEEAGGESFVYQDEESGYKISGTRVEEAQNVVIHKEDLEVVSGVQFAGEILLGLGAVAIYLGLAVSVWKGIGFAIQYYKICNEWKSIDLEKEKHLYKNSKMGFAWICYLVGIILISVFSTLASNLYYSTFGKGVYLQVASAGLFHPILVGVLFVAAHFVLEWYVKKHYVTPISKEERKELKKMKKGAKTNV